MINEKGLLQVHTYSYKEVRDARKETTGRHGTLLAALEKHVL